VADDSENVRTASHPVLPHSRGEIVLDSAIDCPTGDRMNYYDDPRDMQVMVAAIRRQWTSPRIGQATAAGTGP